MTRDDLRTRVNVFNDPATHTVTHTALHSESTRFYLSCKCVQHDMKLML